MAREEKAAEVAQSAPSEQAEFEQTITEFCLAQSKTDKRVELLSAFHHVETVAGHHKALPSVFAARYAEFANAPA